VDCLVFLLCLHLNTALSLLWAFNQVLITSVVITDLLPLAELEQQQRLCVQHP
jgi:hypothetical protein